MAKKKQQEVKQVRKRGDIFFLSQDEFIKKFKNEKIVLGKEYDFGEYKANIVKLGEQIKFETN